jgi:hypothetical protein
MPLQQEAKALPFQIEGFEVERHKISLWLLYQKLRELKFYNHQSYNFQSIKVLWPSKSLLFHCFVHLSKARLSLQEQRGTFS